MEGKKRVKILSFSLPRVKFPTWNRERCWFSSVVGASLGRCDAKHRVGLRTASSERPREEHFAVFSPDFGEKKVCLEPVSHRENTCLQQSGAVKVTMR